LFSKGLPFWSREDALQVEVLEQGKRKVSFNVTRCRYAVLYKDLGIPEFGHLSSCGRDSAMIQGFIPKSKFTRWPTSLGKIGQSFDTLLSL